jgi:hypothetical protein
MCAVKKMVPGVQIGVRCHYCSKFRHPKEIVRIGTGGAKMCWYCYGWHLHALGKLAASPARACQECGVSYAELEQRDRDGNVRLYVHAKDGGYQLLCAGCSDRYIRRRPDLFRDTKFGWEQKLK